MGKIGRFIDHCCEHHPPLMRAVLEKPLAPLREFIAFDESGNACGCLVGTAMIAAGYSGFRKSHFQDPIHYGAARYTRSLGIDDGFSKLARVTDHVFSADTLSEIGRCVWLVSTRFAGVQYSDHRGPYSATPASDARTVHLLRARIARQLAIRESALPISTRLPNEPAEPQVVTQAPDARGAVG